MYHTWHHGSTRCLLSSFWHEMTRTTGKVLIIKAGGVEKKISPGSSSISIGRYQENAIVLPYDYVSGLHGQIFSKGGRFFYRDLDSTNGTYIDELGTNIHIKNKTVQLGTSGILAFGKPGEASITYMVQEAREPGSSDAEELFEKAYTALKQGDFALAFNYFESIIESTPQSAPSYYYAGFAASRLNDVDTAIVRLEQYLALMPRDLRAMVDLGKLYERKGQINKAGARYRKALALAPEDREARQRLEDLKRYELVGDRSHRAPRSTADLLGEDLVETVSTRHFKVTYNIARHGRILNDVLKALEEAYMGVGNHIGLYPPGLVPVILYTGEKELDQVPEGVDTAGISSEGCIKALLTRRTMAEALFLKVLLTHEYVHYVLDSSLPRGIKIPWWLHEGLAQYESQNLKLDHEAMISEMLKHDALIPIEILERGLSAIGLKNMVQLAYSEAYTMVEYLVQTRGNNIIRDIIKGLVQGRDVGNALTHAGIDYECLEAGWQAWLKERLGKKHKGRTREIK